ncbi:hypothetical protein MWU61_18545 [Loktanella sp. F6476L]|uniref:hypothetical protein n=1 Tax=Loktanella sp. F6476L TaxID=2926405 RepID=UPI001FF52F20|nr:hypothetical protein [Loktanella sp. F6476L]MCK0122557.1 hypothetical protein [Loktanella sp. F6476L]
MRELPRGIFDVYALALPSGHGFGLRPPAGAWQSDDGSSIGILTRDIDSHQHGIIVMRQRSDDVWAEIVREDHIGTKEACTAQLKEFLSDGQARVRLPPNTAPRPALHHIGNRTPGSLFDVLRKPTHRIAAWTINQLYLAMPNPDKNWVSDCQTANFHTRMWEAQLLASFREQGLLVTQDYVSPDFQIENRLGGKATVEAVTANPTIAYDHVNTPPGPLPTERDDIFFGTAAVRFAKTLRSKLQREYHRLPHVVGKPFVIALADFHAPASMVWSREALIGYLYGSGAAARLLNGKMTPVETTRDKLLGNEGIPAGLFTDERQSDLSAVIFSNACSISKLYRVGISAGAQMPEYRYTRAGRLFDRTPGALEGVPFCHDITSNEYRAYWPQGYEPWTAEMEVFHNPHALHPTPRELLPEATHWFERNGEIECEAFYETSILWSQTMITDSHQRQPTLDDFLPTGGTEQ